MNDRIIRLKALTGVLAISRSSVYERLNPASKFYDPEFPKAIRLGARSIGFSENQVQTSIKPAPWLT
jgi:prophage regulatory protein